MPDNALKMLRGPICQLGRGGEGNVEPDGGRFKAGVIRGASVIMRGEAAGHGFWVDKTMLQQTSKAINEARPVGRYTHPSLFSDPLGRVLGRWENASVDGQKVRADLHFHASAHKSKDFSLDYILSLAVEDPAVFGVSIAFMPDVDAEREFVEKHTKKSRFVSPDSENADSLPHARLAELAAADLVGEPAANADGLFHRRSQIVVPGPTWRQRRNARAVELDVA